MPTLFIHHPEDPITPYSDAWRIFQEYEGSKEFVTPRIEAARGSHMTGLFDAEVRRRVIQFLKTHLNESH